MNLLDLQTSRPTPHRLGPRPGPNMDLDLGCERFHPRRSATPGRLRVMCLPSDPVSPALTPLSLLSGASVLAYAGLWVLDLKVAALVFALAALASQICQRCRQDDFDT